MAQLNGDVRELALRGTILAIYVSARGSALAVGALQRLIV